MKYLKKFNEQTSNFRSMLPQGFVQAEMTGRSMTIGNYVTYGNTNYNVYYCQTDDGKVLVLENIKQKGKTPFETGIILEKDGKPLKKGYSGRDTIGIKNDLDMPMISNKKEFQNANDVIVYLYKEYPQLKTFNLAGSKSNSSKVGGKALKESNNSKTNEQSIFDKVRGALRGGVGSAGMMYVKSLDSFKNMTEIKNQLNTKYDKQLNAPDTGKIEVIDPNLESARIILDQYDDNVKLLEETIDSYVAGKLDKRGVIHTLNNKLKELKRWERFASTSAVTEPLAKNFVVSAKTLLEELSKDVRWLPEESPL